MKGIQIIVSILEGVVEYKKKRIRELTQEEFKSLYSYNEDGLDIFCPSNIGLEDAYGINCWGKHCCDCWKKATGRK